YSCGVTTGGTAYCWGLNDSGELGDGSTTNSSTPVVVAGGLRFATVSAAKLASYVDGDDGFSYILGHHTCGLTTAGEIYCWGFNAVGQLGNGTVVQSSTPVAVLGGLTFPAVSAGGGHTCGVTPVGAAYCWGANDYGQLGNRAMYASSTPVAVPGGLTFASV